MEIKTKLSEKHEEILKEVRGITLKNIAPYASDVDGQSRFPEESFTALKKAGLMGLLVPEKWGGLGQDIRTMTGVLEAIARECASTALCYLVHLAGTAVYASSSSPRGELLSEAASGNHISSLALGEFGSRSHFWNPISQARQHNGKIFLNASKSFVTNAGFADGYVVITRAINSKSPLETTIYYVSSEEAGIRISGTWDAFGMRGNTSAPVLFKDVCISDNHKLSHPGEGMNMLLNTILPLVNLGVTAICLGIAESVVQITRDHLLKTRLDHLSMQLADLPLERFRLAKMRMETDKIRAHLSMTLNSVMNKSDDAMLLLMESKAAATEMAQTVTDLGMKAAGGTAFNRHLGLERRFRDARTAEFIGITQDMLFEFIGRSICGMQVP